MKKFFLITASLFATPIGVILSSISSTSLMNSYDYSKIISNVFEINGTNLTPNESAITKFTNFHYECDVVNPKLFPMSCFDEYVYYGKLLNEGMVRNLSLVFTIMNYRDNEQQTFQYLINCEHTNDIRGQYTVEVLPFAVSSYTYPTEDDRLTLYSSSAFSINLSTIINQNFDYLNYSLADFVMIKYDSSTDTYMTKLNLDSAPVPTIKDKEIAFYLN
ncbi:MAG: hypothetical protein K2L48_03725 [Mycoplasmoidaceae bacterium]|nr:hypothetical protein [Mycoplasmoidaceae bacterium]